LLARVEELADGDGQRESFVRLLLAGRGHITNMTAENEDAGSALLAHPLRQWFSNTKSYSSEYCQHEK
jgi:hypothetical protein